jgi:hypothetical protein
MLDLSHIVWHYRLHCVSGRADSDIRLDNVLAFLKEIEKLSCQFENLEEFVSSIRQRAKKAVAVKINWHVSVSTLTV